MWHSCGLRRLVAILLVTLLLGTPALAEQGVLVLRVVDVDGSPVAEVRVGLTGASSQFSDQNGQARLRLPPATKPADAVTLEILNPWNNQVLKFISPFNRMVRVPPWEDKPDNVDEVTVAKKHDVAVLEQGASLAAVHTVMDRPAAQQAKPQTQWRRPEMSGPPRLETVAFRTNSNVEESPPFEAQPLTDAGIDAAADYFGLTPAQIKAAVAKWGGTPLLWRMVRVTGTVDTGGSNPFVFVRANNGDLYFGIAPWSLRQCSLQPVLLSFQQRDPKKFAEILGADTQWLSKTMHGSCQLSSKAAAERMLDGPNEVNPVWRERFRRLGYEPEFQHAAIEQMTHELQQAQSLSSQLGLTSEQAVAFSYATLAQLNPVVMQQLQRNFINDAAAFTGQMGREPDQQERLLILANRLAQSRTQAAQSGNQAPGSEPAPPLVNCAKLFSEGTDVLYGQQYKLAEFNIGFHEINTGVPLPLHQNAAILAKLDDGWIPSAQKFYIAAPTTTEVSEKAPLEHVAGGGTPSSVTASGRPSPDGAPSGNDGVMNNGAMCGAAAEQQFADLINQERTSRGIPALQPNADLAEAARRHTKLLIKAQTLSHQFPNEAALPQRLADLNLQVGVIGENVATGTTVTSAHRELMEDEDHRVIILNPKFTNFGVSVMCTNGALYVTQDFARLPRSNAGPQR